MGCRCVACPQPQHPRAAFWEVTPPGDMESPSSPPTPAGPGHARGLGLDWTRPAPHSLQLMSPKGQLVARSPAWKVVIPCGGQHGRPVSSAAIGATQEPAGRCGSGAWCTGAQPSGQKRTKQGAGTVWLREQRPLLGWSLLHRGTQAQTQPRGGFGSPGGHLPQGQGLGVAHYQLGLPHRPFVLQRAPCPG